ncbi:MAG TPA: hypothetical protein VF768_10325 [Holophagaceae bacterium]
MRHAALPFAFCLLAPAFAQGAPGAPTPGPTVGVNLQMAFATGPLAEDVNQHPGFGLGITVPLPLAPGLLLRPNAEMTGTRVTEYNPVGWFFNQDPRDVFRTYKLGVDLQLYPGGDAARGVYLFGGLGAQWSMLDLEASTPDGNQVYATYHRRAGAWFGGGIGYQVSAGSALELRVSTFQYQAPQGLPLDVVDPAPSEDRTATQIHLVWALRIPVR